MYGPCPWSGDNQMSSVFPLCIPLCAPLSLDDSLVLSKICSCKNLSVIITFYFPFPPLVGPELGRALRKLLTQ